MAGRGVSSSAAGSPMPTAGGGSPYMTAAEVNDLQRLLRRARETGQIGRQFMQARISGIEVAVEQKALVEEGAIMTHPDAQFPWVPRPKSKAKAAPAVPTMTFVGEQDDHGSVMSEGMAPGAMSDASKRRFFDDDEDPDASLAEFEVVQAINEFNSGMRGPHWNVGLDEVPMVTTNPQVAATDLIPPGFPVQTAPLVPTTRYAVQGENEAPPAEDASWYPEVSQEIQDVLINVPHAVPSPMVWGRTLVTMPKYKDRRWTYEQMLRMALGGHGEVATYLNFLLEKYGMTYRRHGARSQAADFAGYLLRYRVRILKVAANTGFNREVVG